MPRGPRRQNHTGVLAERLAALGCRLTGLDFSAAMLEKARAKLPDAEFVEWGEPGPTPPPGWKADRWDEHEHYWIADEAMRVLSAVGLRTTYRQVSFCSGVYVVEPVDRAHPCGGKTGS